MYARLPPNHPKFSGRPLKKLKTLNDYISLDSQPRYKVHTASTKKDDDNDEGFYPAASHSACAYYKRERKVRVDAQKRGKGTIRFIRKRVKKKNYLIS